MIDMITIRRDLAKATARRLINTYDVKAAPVPIEKIIKQEKISLVCNDNVDSPSPYCTKTEEGYSIVLAFPAQPYEDRWEATCMFGHIILNHFELYQRDTIYRPARGDHTIILVSSNFSALYVFSISCHMIACPIVTV